MSTVGDFVASLAASLETVTSIAFVAGPVTAAQENRDLGCIWLERKTPMGSDGNMEVCEYGVRLIRNWTQGQGANEAGRNVQVLWNDVEILQGAFRDVLTTAGHDFFTVLGVAPDYDSQYVEASLVAYQRNMGARGG